MKEYKEVTDRETGLSRSVDTAGESFSDKVKELTRRRGFMTVRSYIRGARSTASSDIPVASSEPAKMASFQPYFAKFCRPLNNGIEYRISKHVKRLGAGSVKSKMIKQAGAMVHIPKIVDKAATFSSKAKSFLGRNKGGIAEVAVLGNSINAGRDFENKGYKSNLYHRVSFGLAGATLGLRLGRAAATGRATVRGSKKGTRAVGIVQKRINEIIKKIPANSAAKDLSKKQMSAVLLSRNPERTAKSAFEGAALTEYAKAYKAKELKYGLIGAGAVGIPWATVSDETRKDMPIFRLL